MLQFVWWWWSSASRIGYIGRRGTSCTPHHPEHGSGEVPDIQTALGRHRTGDNKQLDDTRLQLGVFYMLQGYLA